MKKINTLLATAIAIIFISGVSSCNKKIELLVDIDEQKVCLPAYNSQLSSGHLYTFEYALAKVRSEFDKQGLTYAENRINDIKASAFTIKFESGAQGSLKELSGAQVWVKKVGESGLGTQIADVTIPESDVAELNFNVGGQSLKSYLAEEKIVFSVTVFQRYSTGSKAVCVYLTGGKLSIEAKK
jgi:hypothetical protein